MLYLISTDSRTILPLHPGQMLFVARATPRQLSVVPASSTEAGTVLALLRQDEDDLLLEPTQPGSIHVNGAAEPIALLKEGDSLSIPGLGLNGRVAESLPRPESSSSPSPPGHPSGPSAPFSPAQAPLTAPVPHPAAPYQAAPYQAAPYQAAPYQAAPPARSAGVAAQGVPTTEPIEMIRPAPQQMEVPETLFLQAPGGPGPGGLVPETLPLGAVSPRPGAPKSGAAPQTVPVVSSSQRQGIAVRPHLPAVSGWEGLVGQGWWKSLLLGLLLAGGMVLLVRFFRA